MSVTPGEADAALGEIEARIARRPGAGSLGEVCEYLRRTFPHYRWVGIYRLNGAMLDLSAWNGPAATEHTRIPIGSGICGRAAREDRTVIVDDVRVAPEYLACFRETRSEIVVPIHRDGRVLGEIDIDGNEVGAFDGTDRAFLERVAERLTGPLSSEASGRGPHA